MGLKKALQKEREQDPTDEELSFEDIIANDINENRELWLQKVNIHLEKLLHKANRENQMLRHMADHYHTRNKI